MTPTTTTDRPLREIMTSPRSGTPSAERRPIRTAPNLHALAAAAVFIFMAAVVLKLI